MRILRSYITLGLMIGLLASGSALAEQSTTPLPYGHGDTGKLPNGVIGISLHIGAEQIGDPAILYVGMVHPEGPAHKAGLRHGDELISVDGIPVKGKRYEEVVTMIRGEAGTVVKVGAKDDKGLHELSIERVAGDKLPKGPSGSHGTPAP
ncbi:MAG: PDZ domain-containing protein [Nitrospira sp.]|nr:PDZ domain-containing protein [Nitrospira sp.]